MKILKIIGISILVLIIIVVVGLFIFLKTFDLNRYRQQITEEASKSLGRKVQIGQLALNLSLSKGTILKVDGVNIADLPEFSQESIVSIKSVLLDVDLMALLTKREIVVSRIAVIAPRLNIVRDKFAVMNIQKITPPSDSIKSVPQQATTNNLSSLKKENTKLPALLVKMIRFQDGEVAFTDLMTQPNMSVQIKDMSLVVNNFSLDQPFSFEFASNIFANKPNIHLKGSIKINALKQEASVSDLKISTDLALIDLQKVVESVEALKPAGLESLGGQLNFFINHFEAGAAGLKKMDAKMELVDGKLKVQALGHPIDNIDMNVDMTESLINLKQLFVYLASGKINVSGKLEDYLKSQKFSFTASVEDLKADELLPPNLPAKFQGKIFANFSGSGQGFTLPQLKQNLSAEGKIDVKEAKVSGVNLLKGVLDKIPFMPGPLAQIGEQYLIAQLESQLPEQYKEKLRGEETLFKRVEVNMNVKNGEMISKAEVEADEFIFFNDARLDFDQNLFEQPDCYLSADFSKYIVLSVDQFAALQDQDGRIHIPFKSYEGKLANFNPAVLKPDLADFGKKAIKQEINNLLRDVLGGGDQTQNSQATSDQNDTQNSKPQDTRPDEIISDVLESLPFFKK